MAHSQEYNVQGFKMKVTFEILEVPRDRVIEELECRGYKTSEENIKKLTESIKGHETYDFTEVLDEQIIEGNSGNGYGGSYSIFECAFEIDSELEELEEEDEDEDE